jgi:hypothetical protein
VTDEHLRQAHEAAVRAAMRRIARRGGDPHDPKHRSAILAAGMRAVDMASRAGCVQLRRCRQTGHLVGVYRSLEAGIESDPDLPWSTVCEEHSTVVCSATRHAAELAASWPDFCDECREILYPRSDG